MTDVAADPTKLLATVTELERIGDYANANRLLHALADPIAAEAERRLRDAGCSPQEIAAR